MKFSDKIYGQLDITEPVVLELINTPTLQRLKKIHQYGVYYLFYPAADTNRFEHSLGVYWVLKKFGASLAEQVAGLLHDISHGVFSHVLDHLHNTTANEEYQETIHQRFFKDNDIAAVLEKYNLNIERISNPQYWPLLEKPLPNICADRLQYTLADAVTIGKNSSAQALALISDIKIENNQFVFKTLKPAKEFAELSLWMCQNFLHVSWGTYSFSLMSEILKKALAAGIIRDNDLFSDDETICERLSKCQNTEIVGLLHKLINFKIDRVTENMVNFDFIKKISKFRTVDPLVETDNQIKRVSEIFKDFKEKFDSEKQRVSQPRYLRYIDKPNE